MASLLGAGLITTKATGRAGAAIIAPTLVGSLMDAFLRLMCGHGVGVTFYYGGRALGKVIGGTMDLSVHASQKLYRVAYDYACPNLAEGIRIANGELVARKEIDKEIEVDLTSVLSPEEAEELEEMCKQTAQPLSNTNAAA